MCSESNNIRQIRSIKKSWFYRLCATFFEKLYEVCNCPPGVQLATPLQQYLQQYSVIIQVLQAFAVLPKANALQ